jgi:hypothetical protein
MVIPSYHGTVNISVVDHRSVYPYHCCVITEPIAIPSAAAVTIATITVAIINASIKAYMRPPISYMEAIITTHVTPVRRRPVKAGVRRGHPHAGYPVITIRIIVSPVTGLP